ncbi:MAG: type II secretion system protein GspM [Coriobacteriia bacterium]|nr:type II secretion system protein GspM [Coriobacteriia bacterium]
MNLKREFTPREIVLMVVFGVIILGCLYYLFVYSPAMQSIQAAQSNVSSLTTQITAQQTRVATRNQLKTQLDELQAKGASTGSLPKYDNSKNCIAALNGILDGTASYSVSFGEVEITDSMARRPVTVSFTTDTYGQAQDVMNRLINCQYTCLVSDFTLATSKSGSTGAVSKVTGSAVVTFFEQV